MTECRSTATLAFRCSRPRQHGGCERQAGVAAHGDRFGVCGAYPRLFWRRCPTTPRAIRWRWRASRGSRRRSDSGADSACAIRWR